MKGNIRKKKEQTIKKEMLTVKFRYLDSEQEYRSNTITIGIFDTIEEAVQHGNDVLESLTANPSFNLRQGEKFRVHDLFGLPSRLITNCTSNCPVEFYVKITRLDFDDLHKTIDNVLKRVQSKVAQA